jgi:hypothetical protein
VTIRRDGQVHRMNFKDGDRASNLSVTGTVPKKQTGTTVRFWPDPKYFDSPKISLPRLKHVLRAKAVLCAGLTVRLFDEASGESSNGTTKTVCATTCVRCSAKPSAFPPTSTSGSTTKATAPSNSPPPGCPKASSRRKATST